MEDVLRFSFPLALLPSSCVPSLLQIEMQKGKERELDCGGLVSVGASGSSVPIFFKVVNASVPVKKIY